jgi:hypothetical protein
MFPVENDVVAAPASAPSELSARPRWREVCPGGYRSNQGPGTSGNTARVHLARLMSKTKTHRQAELVILPGGVASLQGRDIARPFRRA